MVGFFDDSTSITGGSPQDSYQKMKQMITADAQLWHEILWVTGGKLELSKCGYHLIYFDFDSSGLPRMRVNPPNDSVILKNQQGEEIEIKEKKIYIPRKNLGHYKALSGIFNTEFEVQREKAREVTLAINLYGLN